MRHERQVELLRRLKGLDPLTSWPPPEHSMGNPASAYVDPAWFEVLFRQHPQILGLSSECAAPGSRTTAELGGVPVVVVRQADGTLKGFVNACRKTKLAGRRFSPRLRRVVGYRRCSAGAPFLEFVREYAECCPKSGTTRGAKHAPLSLG
jgi:hypothetical protein